MRKIQDKPNACLLGFESFYLYYKILDTFFVNF